MRNPRAGGAYAKKFYEIQDLIIIYEFTTKNFCSGGNYAHIFMNVRTLSFSGNFFFRNNFEYSKLFKI